MMDAEVAEGVDGRLELGRGAEREQCFCVVSTLGCIRGAVSVV